MNKSTLILSLLFTTGVIVCQTQIPNSNFENWTIAENGTDSLLGWSSSNAIVISPVISLYSDDASFQGDFAGNLVTAPFGFVQYSTIGMLVNGDAIFDYGGGGGGGNVQLASGGGTPISYKPTELVGHYRTTTLSPGDLPFAKVVLTKFNVDLNQRDTVSYAEYSFDSSEDFSPFTIPLVDLLPDELPDTVTTIFYSSHPELVGEFGVWSNLHLDSLYLSPVVPSDIEVNVKDEVVINLFPNPTTGVFNVENLSNVHAQIGVYNVLGDLVKLVSINSSAIQTLDMSEFPSGVYFVKPQVKGQRAKRLVIVR